jgi:glutamate synthase domain-containing protein 3
MTTTPPVTAEGVIEGYAQVAPPVTRDGGTATIDAGSIYYTQLNAAIREAIEGGVKRIVLESVNGQRYIGTGIRRTDVRIEVHGTAGNGLAMFMGGPEVEVYGSAQDGVGYVRGVVEEYKIGKECGIFIADENDIARLRPILQEHCAAFDMDVEEVLSVPFTKLIPISHRPYGKLYAY